MGGIFARTGWWRPRGAAPARAVPGAPATARRHRPASLTRGKSCPNDARRLPPSRASETPSGIGDSGEGPWLTCRTPLIAGNWKMNGLVADGGGAGGVRQHGSRGGGGCDLLVCPPATLLGPSAEALAGSGVGLGGQDCHDEASGAHTGDISAAHAGRRRLPYVIVGHSERRHRPRRGRRAGAGQGARRCAPPA